MFELGPLYLYHPQSFFDARMPSGAEALGDYAVRLRDGLNNAYAALSGVQPANRALIVAIYPGGKPKSWLVSGSGRASAEEDQLTQTVVQNVEPPEVVDGPLAFGFKYTLAGRVPGQELPDPPFPHEWQEVVARGGEGPLDIDTILERLA